MERVELPLKPEEDRRRKALRRESFWADTDSLRPHPLHKQYSVPMPKEEYERLKESIRRYGVRVPLTVWEGRILGGVHRWRAARELGLKRVPVLPLDVEDEREAAVWIVRENLDRRQLTPGQKAMLAKALYELEKERAGLRQEATRRSRDRGGKFSTTVDPQEKGKARERAAQQVGISGRTLEKAIKAVEKRPELEEKLRRGEISVERAYRLARGQPDTKPRDRDRERKEEEKPKGGRVPTVGPQLEVTLPKQHFERLCALARQWGLKEKELASHGLMEWLAAQTDRTDPERGRKEPQLCLRLPWERYRVLERLCRPAGEPVAYLARFILCSVALHPEKYPELLAPVRVD